MKPFLVLLAFLVPLSGGVRLAREGGRVGGTQSVNRYVLPNGSGKKDGSSWEDALDASQGGLQKGWEELAPGATLWVGSGTYTGVGLVIGSGGELGSPKTVCGKDTGGGLPLFSGTFDRTNPAKTGQTLVSVKAGTSYWRVQDLRAENYRLGVVSSGGRHREVAIHGLMITGCREGISLDGGATVAEPAMGSQKVEIRGCVIRNYTKRGVRLKNGNHEVQVMNCIADAGGKAWATEPFQMGFQVEGGAVDDHHITFTDCVARNNYDEQGGDPKKYWNADGFDAESGTHDLSFVRCKAFDNTDGGWDVKSTGTMLTDCVSLGNKRNYRFWGAATLTNCVSAFALKRGGSGGADGMWASGTVTAQYCTFYNNGTGVSVTEKGKVTLERCILAREKERVGKLSVTEAGGMVAMKECALYEGTGEEPRLRAPKAGWQGEGDAFDSAAFGRERGYASVRRRVER